MTHKLDFCLKPMLKSLMHFITILFYDFFLFDELFKFLENFFLTLKTVLVTLTPPQYTKLQILTLAF